MKFSMGLLLLFSATSFAEEIPVGVTRFRLDPPVTSSPVNVEAARYVLSSGDALKASCPNGQKILSAACESSDTNLNYSGGAASRLLNSRQADVVIASENESTTATCNAKFMRPDDVMKLSMTLKCADQTVSLNSKKN